MKKGTNEPVQRKNLDHNLPFNSLTFYKNKIKHKKNDNLYKNVHDFS